MAAIDYSAMSKTTQTDLCALAIMQTAAALQTDDGKAAIENGRTAYLRHLAEKGKTK